MKKKRQVSLRVFIVTLVLVLIVTGSFAGYFGIKLKQEARAREYDASTLLLLEGTFDIVFPEGASVCESVNTRGSFGDGDTYDVIIIPAEDMDSFGAQIEQLDWIEYTPDLFDGFIEEYDTWNLLDVYERYVPIRALMHGYVIFLADDNLYLHEGTEFYYPNGSVACGVDEAMIFYDDITGRLYFYTYSW